MLGGPLNFIGACAVSFVVGMGYGYLQWNDSAKVDRLEAKIELYKLDIRALEADAKLAVRDSKQLAKLDRTIKELRNELSEKDRVCFAGPDADRLRDLFKD